MDISLSHKKAIISNFASVIGVDSLIGLHTDNVLGYSTRAKRCAVCEATLKNGSASRKHDCLNNWTGSSKAVEQHVAAELIVSVSQHYAQANILLGGEDSNTIKKVRERERA